MNIIRANAKAITALLLLGVAALATALGVDTGIDVQEQGQVLVVALLTALGVWAVPNDPDA